LRRGWWQRLRAVAGLELAVQRREPATVLYALVFGLLTFAFVSSGAVELVRDRGPLPKLSALAITLAITGLTAFGQVITTMVAASAVLRDSAWRTESLLGTTRLEGDAWLAGRWLATLVVLLTVSTAMLGGVLVGAAAWWVPRDMPWLTVAGRAARAWLGLTAPTVMAVGTLLVVAASRTRRLLGVLGAALALLFLWQAAEAAARRVPAASPAGWAAALLDPFGSVAVQQVVVTWSDAQRAGEAVPLAGRVAAGRLLWLGAAFGLLLLEARRVRRVGLLAPARAPDAGAEIGDTDPPAYGATPSGSPARPAAASHPLVPGPITHRGVAPPLATHAAFRAIASFAFTWTWRERGWRIIGALGVLNVFAQALALSGEVDAVALLAVVREHARLFLILLATIYAGEVLWRDHDERVVELVASAPVRPATLVAGRLLGLLPAQAALTFGVLLAGVLGALVRGHGVAAAMPAVALGGLFWLLLPFVQWLWLSLAVHVLVRDKIVAHLLLITTWVAAVTLDGVGVTSPWLRITDPPPLVPGAALPLAEAWWRAAWSCVIALAGGLVAVAGWERATRRR
jgi:ABC-2 type transport system permease protein